MVVGIEDGLRWIDYGQLLRIRLAVNVVIGATIDGEMGRLVDKCSSPGICTGVGSVPEGWADVDRSKYVGSWLRDLSVTE